MKKGYITFDEGLKLVGKAAFSTMAKPIGSICNLNCDYCYYIDKQRFYGRKQMMSETLLETYIKEYILTNEIPEVTFVWHGGEPLMAGLNFYKKAIEFQKKYNTESKKIVNTLQTNGTLINEEWCKFFKKNNFLIGVSIDGPEDIHNAYRKNKIGINSFERVMRGINLLKRYNVDFNTLTVVNNLSEGRGAEIYQFLKSIGSQFQQYLPCVDYLSQDEKFEDRSVIVSPVAVETQGVLAPWSVSALGYGRFLIDIFDVWVRRDVGTTFVQLFDMTLCAWCGMEPAVCAYKESCGDVLAIEHNGDIYSCDHFVFPENKLGNINEQKIVEMLRSKQQVKFGLNKRNTLSRECLRCEYYFACRGECPKHRHIETADGDKKFTLCDGIKMYYKHTEPYMKFMKEQLVRGQAPANVMRWAK